MSTALSESANTTQRQVWPIYDKDAEPAAHLNVVLSLGMRDDIMMVLNLVPEADVIFVIDDNDDSHKDLGDLYDRIKTTLTEGKRPTVKGMESESHLRPLPLLATNPFHYLSKGKAVIEADARYRERDPAIEWNWRLRFRYGGKNRVLMRFERSPSEAWPAGVTNVSHVILHRKVDLGLLDRSPYQGEIIRNLLTNTSTKGYRLYGQATRYWYPNFVIVQSGANPRGTCVGYVDIKPDYVFTNIVVHAIDANDPMVNLLVMETGRVYKVRWRKYPFTKNTSF